MTLPLPPKISPIRTILGIDPGSVESAFVVYQKGKILDKGLLPNPDMLRKLGWLKMKYHPDILAIERIANYGKVVGASIFDTAFWAGRFCEQWNFTFVRIYRRKVKQYLGLGPQTGDSQVNACVRDYFLPAGKTTKGKPSHKGTMKHPGPLYGVVEDIWAALAIAVAYDENEAIIQRGL